MQERWPWLPQLVLAVVEFKSSDFRRVGEAALRRVAGIVRNARYAEVDELSTRVDGHLVGSGSGTGVRSQSTSTMACSYSCRDASHRPMDGGSRRRSPVR